MDEPELPDAKWKRAFRRQLIRWYAKHARDLPWRRSRDPYHVWISEIMLQQTQVATVIPYFERFTTALPSIADLPKAEEEVVLRLWEGLGYYRRARQLHQAARQIVELHGGVFPAELASVDALPGIGRYTRGAVLSIAFGQRQPVLEANTLRLYCRLLAYQSDPNSTAGQSLLWAFAKDILPRKDVGVFNQALMELGGLICTPKAPRCLICPVAGICPTRAAGLQDVIPAPKQRLAYEDLFETAVVVARQQDVLLRRCQPDERWAGLWDFLRFESGPRPHSRAHIRHQVARLSGLDVVVGECLATIKHGVTRYRITLTCLMASHAGGRLRSTPQLAWVNVKELDSYPLSVTGRRIAKLFLAREKHSGELRTL